MGLGGIFGPLSVVGILATAPSIFMIALAAKIIRDLYLYSQGKRAGALGYGFLIDEKQLAVRTIAAFSDNTYFFGENSVLLPLERIRGSSIGQNPTYAMSGRMRKAKVLIVCYIDERGKLRQVHIPDRFDLPVSVINDLLRNLNHNLVGTWMDSYGNATIQFDQDSGIVTGNDGKVHHFRWREIEGAALEVIPRSESIDELQAGLYHFTVRAKGNSFELSFLEGFGGTFLRQFKRAHTDSEAAMDPIRVAARLAASKPLPELGPLFPDKELTA